MPLKNGIRVCWSTFYRRPGPENWVSPRWKTTLAKLLLVEALGHISMLIKRSQIIAAMVFAAAEAACILMAAGWFRQLGTAGLIRARHSMQKRVVLPPGYTLALPNWPARLRGVALAEAVSDWHKYTASRCVSIFGHTVFLPRAIRKLDLWGHVRSGGPLKLIVRFHGHERSATFRIPIQMERVDFGQAGAYGSEPPSSGEAPAIPRWMKPITYGRPVPGDLIISWIHHIRMSPSGNAVMPHRLVKPFQIFIPPWTNTVGLSWKKASDQATPRTGFTASSLGRHLVLSASWDWSNHGRVTVERNASDVFVKARRTLRLSGCPPWLLAHAVRHGLALLRGLSAEDILRMSLGICPRYWKPRKWSDLRLATMVIASERVAGLDSHSAGSLFYLPMASGSLYYSSGPEIHFRGRATVARHSFYLFGPSGDLRVGGYVVTTGSDSGYRGIGLAAGALGFLPANHEQAAPGRRGQP
jgi:hypothetical protein